MTARNIPTLNEYPPHHPDQDRPGQVGREIPDAVHVSLGDRRIELFHAQQPHDEIEDEEAHPEQPRGDPGSVSWHHLLQPRFL
jgi:hypothetical protein